MLSNRNNPKLINKCTLITEISSSDNLCDDETQEEKAEVYCAEFSVPSSETNSTITVGIKSEKGLILHSLEYKGQEKVIFNDTKYSIYKVYPRTDGFVELYLAKRLGS